MDDKEGDELAGNAHAGAPHATYHASTSSSDGGWVLKPPWGHSRCTWAALISRQIRPAMVWARATTGSAVAVRPAVDSVFHESL